MSANVATKNKHVTSFNDIGDNIATKTISTMNGTVIAINLNNARNFTLYKNCFSACSLNSKRYFLYSSSIFSSLLCCFFCCFSRLCRFSFGTQLHLFFINAPVFLFLPLTH